MTFKSKQVGAEAFLTLTLATGAVYYLTLTLDKKKEYDLPAEHFITMPPADPIAAIVGTQATYSFIGQTGEQIAQYELWRESLSKDGSIV